MKYLVGGYTNTLWQEITIPPREGKILFLHFDDDFDIPPIVYMS